MNNNKINHKDTFDIKKHISPSDLSAFQERRLSSIDLEKFLEHIGSCDFCSDLLAENMEKELISAPIDMKDNIINLTKRLDVQIGRRAEGISKRMRLFLYSLKVTAATIGALILLLFTNKIPCSPYQQYEIPKEITVSEMSQTSLTSTIRYNMDQFSNKIYELSNTMLLNNNMNKEVIENDKKEK